MTSQKTVEKCRKEKADLLEANKTLLKNNTQLLNENTRLKLELNKNIETIKEIEIQKKQCKQKCELIIQEKDKVIREKEQRLANCKSVKEHLDSGVWTKNITQTPNGLVIELNVKFK